MFYDLFCELCQKKGVSPTRATVEIGLSRTIGTKWKTTGATPQGETLSKIADYFGISVDYLLGNESKEKPISDFGERHRPPDEETLRLLEILEDRPDIRYLAAASEKATPEHVEATARMFDELYGGNKDK